MDATTATDVREDTLNGELTLTEFAAQHTMALTRFAYLLSSDNQLAEDLVQDAFLGLYRRFGETITVAAPVAYARRAIVNAVISRGRRRASGELVTDEVPDRAVPGVDDASQDAMWRALGVLPERQRAVLVLRYYLDLPDREIANTIGLRPGTVRSLATRAFAALREHPALASDTTEESS